MRAPAWKRLLEAARRTCRAFVPSAPHRLASACCWPPAWRARAGAGADRAGQSRSLRAQARDQIRKSRRASRNPPARRPGASDAPTTFTPPPSGAGTTGFDASNDPDRPAKTQARSSTSSGSATPSQGTVAPTLGTATPPLSGGVIQPPQPSPYDQPQIVATQPADEAQCGARRRAARHAAGPRDRPDPQEAAQAQGACRAGGPLRAARHPRRRLQPLSGGRAASAATTPIRARPTERQGRLALHRASPNCACSPTGRAIRASRPTCAAATPATAPTRRRR